MNAGISNWSCNRSKKKPTEVAVRQADTDKKSKILEADRMTQTVGRGKSSRRYRNRGTGNTGDNMTAKSKKPQNIREIKDIVFTVSSKSKSSEVESKMKRFIELLKADEKFGDY